MFFFDIFNKIDLESASNPLSLTGLYFLKFLVIFPLGVILWGAMTILGILFFLSLGVLYIVFNVCFFAFGLRLLFAWSCHGDTRFDHIIIAYKIAPWEDFTAQENPHLRIVFRNYFF